MAILIDVLSQSDRKAFEIPLNSMPGLQSSQW